MKALRILFLFLLAAFSFAASAQTIEIYKDGRVIDSFSATQVDSVVYTPAAAQPRYYYYAGWDCPNSVEDLENRGTEIENFEAMSSGTQIREFAGELTHSRGDYFIVVPNNVGLYDGEGSTRIESTYKTIDSSITGYNIYSGRGPVINGCIIKKL